MRKYNTKPNKTSYKKGQKKHSKSFGVGDKMSDVAKSKISESLKGKTGENARNWKGGKTKIRFLIPQLEEYKLWRSSVFERDSWTCQTCNIKGCYLEAHHIYPLRKIIDEYEIKNSNDAKKCDFLWEINNGATLCRECHKLTKGRPKKYE